MTGRPHALKGEALLLITRLMKPPTDLVEIGLVIEEGSLKARSNWPGMTICNGQPRPQPFR